MREIRTSGSEGGGAGNSTGPPYPYEVWRPPGSRFGHSTDSDASCVKRMGGNQGEKSISVPSCEIREKTIHQDPSSKDNSDPIGLCGAFY
jgi:hypothetical protein